MKINVLTRNGCLLVLTLLLGLMPSIGVAQTKFEIQEITGKITAFDPGHWFAYQYVRMIVNNEEERFSFYPHYGEMIVKNFKVGDELKVKVKVNIRARENLKKLSKDQQEKVMYFRMDLIVEIWSNDRWLPLSETKNESDNRSFKVFLEKKIKLIDAQKNGFFFDENKVGYVGSIRAFSDPLKKLSTGDIVSFTGYALQGRPGFVYPVPDVSEVYSFSQLSKKVGTLKSYLYKQNHVCIGAKFITDNGEMSVSFPSDNAVRIQNLLKPEKPITFYHLEYKIEEIMNAPEVHVLIQDKDTLYIDRFNFYGGADVSHDHKQATVSGKIKEVTRSDKGRIISLVVNNDSYIEMDPRFEKQLGSLLKRGVAIEVSGEERIKKDGEIYSKDYRIITPQQITLEGKVYLLNQLP